MPFKCLPRWIGGSLFTAASSIYNDYLCVVPNFKFKSFRHTPTPIRISKFNSILNRLVTSRIPAVAYVCLNSAEEVAKAISIVRSTGSKFAIRSAGHNANPGFSSVGSSEAGVVLDLHGLNSKTLDKKTNIVRMGSGNIWSETFTWLEENGLSAIGAREGQVELSGFLLGGMLIPPSPIMHKRPLVGHIRTYLSTQGGQGAFPSLYGLGVDSVKNFEVIGKTSP